MNRDTVRPTCVHDAVPPRASVKRGHDGPHRALGSTIVLRSLYVLCDKQRTLTVGLHTTENSLGCYV